MLLKRILLVDDEPDIQTVTKMALEALGGFVVEVCGSAGEALTKAPVFGPELILLDVMMPGLDGPSTLKALREVPGIDAIPVIFLTAKVQAHEIAHYKELGALDVIAKPFDPMSISGNIKKIWDSRHG